MRPTLVTCRAATLLKFGDRRAAQLDNLLGVPMPLAVRLKRGESIIDAAYVGFVSVDIADELRAGCSQIAGLVLGRSQVSLRLLGGSRDGGDLLLA